jgi:hypothetical protein
MFYSNSCVIKFWVKLNELSWVQILHAFICKYKHDGANGKIQSSNCTSIFIKIIIPNKEEGAQLSLTNHKEITM